MTDFPRKPLINFVVLTMIVALSACSSEEQKQQAAPQPVVSVITVKPQTIALETTLTGRLEASRKAEIRARVPGVVQKRLFEEGSEVKAGEALFLIDDTPYRAALSSARANYAKAKADMKRMRPLMEAGAVSRQEWDAVVQMYRISKANLQTADINLSHAHVTAPISGRTGRAEVTEGALVGQGAPTLLTTIRQTNPMHVNMTRSAEDVMKMRAALTAGKVKNIDQIPVTVAFEDGSTYPLEGRLLFTDPTVDEHTGQVTLRAEIPNPDGVLFPGLFVKVRVAQTEVPDAVLIPQQAVSRSKAGDTVMLMKDDGTYAPHPVTIEGQKDRYWIVSDGLQAGEKVIVDGLMTAQMMRAKKVETREWSPDGEKQTSAVQAASSPVSAEK